MSPKNISNEKKITLIMSKEEASEKIKNRIESGKKMLKSPMNNEEEIEDLKNKKASWSDYNVELLKRLFSDDSISKEYQSTSGAIRAVPFDPYSTGSAWGVKLENLKNSLNAKINKLESIFERLELFSEIDGVYANDMIVNHTKEEFIMDFLVTVPQHSGSVTYKIIISPSHTKRIIIDLKKNLEIYEQKFGKISLAEEPSTIGFRPPKKNNN